VLCRNTHTSLPEEEGWRFGLNGIKRRRIFKQCLKVDLYLQLKESPLREIYEGKYPCKKLKSLLPNRKKT